MDPVLFLVVFFGGFGFVLVVVLRGVIGVSEDAKAWVASRQRMAAFEERERNTDYVAMLRTRDPDFSLALFEDMARALFVRAQEARHDPEALGRLAPYLDARVRGQLGKREPVGVPVTTAIVGAMRLERWRLNELVNRFAVDVHFEANLVLADDTQVVRETWLFERAARARTRPWEGVRAFGCPGCGAPLERVSEELCQSCGEEVRPGRFDWTAGRIESVSVEGAGASLTGTVPERGTDRPTIVDPGLAQGTASLLADDPDALTGFEARLRLVFAELGAAWEAQDLRPARPFLSAGLFATLTKQVEAYVAQGLVNAVADARIERWEPVRVLRETRHDALTLRLFGAGCDYTCVKATGQVVGGDKSANRPYSEYWTFVRGSEVRGAPRSDKACPQCAGPLVVGMEGNCEHCGALVASGDFDWVLSGIEQDDAYGG
jgi:hypothetical protein